MKNILLLCESYGAGTKTYIDSIMSNQSKFNNCKFTVFVSSTRLSKEEEINNSFIVEDNLSFGKSFKRFISALRKIHYVVKERDINIIHANSTFSGLLVYFYSLYNKEVSIIYTPHGYYSFKPMKKFKKKIVCLIERYINKRCNKIIHVSKSEERQALEHKVVSPENSLVIFNGVDSPGVRKIISNDKKTFNIVNLARVDDQKNPYDFLKIAKSVVKHRDNVQFIWAGDGKYLDDIKGCIREENLEHKIKFIGFLKDKKQLLSEADIYLSTSHYEGLPFSVVEAMSYGVPLLLSSNVGHSDLIEDGVNGYLYRTKDISHASDYIYNILDSGELHRSLSENCYQIYEKKFSLDTMLKRLSSTYNNL
ncbi:glycosyltransferase [Priestia endophytica]|uniref:glycosyltransferase n=1 Tax=Priestia endophytica TaxID=135735 RepID=UPI003D26B58B